MMTSPFTLMKGDYFTGLTRSRIIRWLRVQDPQGEKRQTVDTSVQD